MSIEHTVPEHVPPELVVDFNYYDQPGGSTDPHAAWKRLHSGPDIFYSPQFGGHWVITRGEDIKCILNDHERFSSYRNAIPDFPRDFRLAPIETDPPLHARYKALLIPTFAPANVRHFEQEARQLTIELIESFRARGQCEFVGDFALRMPISVFMRLTALPDADRSKLLEWVETKVRNPDEQAQLEAQSQLVAYARTLARERRASPGDDLFSRIATARIDGELIPKNEVAGFLILLLFAGLDTVSSSLGFVARFLAEHPAHRRQLISDPALIPKALEELLRRFGVSTPSRMVACDLEFRGVSMKQGDMVLLPVTLYGIDERVYPDWQRVDFTRNDASLHLAFGSGIHRCLGSFLARTELRVFVEEWLRRIPDFRIDESVSVLTSAGVVNGTHRLGLAW